MKTGNTMAASVGVGDGGGGDGGDKFDAERQMLEDELLQAESTLVGEMQQIDNLDRENSRKVSQHDRTSIPSRSILTDEVDGSGNRSGRSYLAKFLSELFLRSMGQIGYHTNSSCKVYCLVLSSSTPKQHNHSSWVHRTTGGALCCADIDGASVTKPLGRSCRTYYTTHDAFHLSLSSPTTSQLGSRFEGFKGSAPPSLPLL